MHGRLTRTLKMAGFAMSIFASSHRESAAREIDFNRDIRPILSNNCFQCHGPDAEDRKGGTDGLRLDTFEGATADLGGYQVVVPGHPEKSDLLERLTTTDADLQMPPPASGKKVSAEEIELLRGWIQLGSPYAAHWSFVKPVRPASPEVKFNGWARNDIDQFILTKLERSGHVPSPEADRRTIARRVSLDLVGLPPDPDEFQEFLNDSSHDAYERYVDRLLAKPSFGEHWARMWLDLARYADSAGYADDPERTIWLYRDYVIRAFNENKPFDQFTIEQLAGDLLPDPTADQRIATAFHRNTLTNNEGGTNDEEFRNVAVVDRVNTTLSVWMGLTMACAQCHTHKFDPITQEEYFRVFAIFNNTADADRKDESPLFNLFTAEQIREREKLQRAVEDAENSLKTMTPELQVAMEMWELHYLNEQEKNLSAPAPVSDTKEAAASTEKEQSEFPAPIVEILNVPIANRTPEQMQLLVTHFQKVTPLLADARQELETLRTQLEKIRPMTVPVCEELPDGNRRVTRIQLRGNYLNLGDEVSPGTPAAFPPIPNGLQANRLGLAHWLVDEQNPLTPRVIANRYWEQIFGIGLVSTSEDFGSQGELPSHPELLDWLATEMIRLEWDTKAFLKLLVTSAAYRQSSRVTPEMMQEDPDNRLLARGPRFRMSAEMIRDQALALSGLLGEKMYGPPVKPPQPASGLTAAFGSGVDWVTSEGVDRYRRGIYTSFRRSNPYPSMATFDAPNREVCTIRRVRTNTPLQALVTLNDPVFLEAAQGLARRVLQAGRVDPAQQIKSLFQLCLGREPQPEELKRLLLLHEDARQVFESQPEKAMELATQPLGPVPSGMETTELATTTLVANVVLNLDELLMKP
ncbi:PSD1 and planctomycete cytochrome C domain-containing protein [Planctomicrobium sp. SH661]|uniref:PSD1 and planctomycete cytochrome C domain-containing protein n=1 Tax=Planctomicrobium sp. SH661 TaxID=3448124 RepID=UPI003F5C21C8